MKSAPSTKVRTSYLPNRGDVVWLIFDPVSGHEQGGRRPGLVLSLQAFTVHTSLAMVCPITTRRKGLPFEVPLRGQKITGSVLPIHTKCLDVSIRKIQYIEKAPVSVTRRAIVAVGAIAGLGENGQI